MKFITVALATIAGFAVAFSADARSAVDAGNVLTEHENSDAAISDDVRSASAERFSDYVTALKSQDYQAAYTMLRLSYQAANPRLEWEMNLRARDGLWADGQIRTLRVTWYQNPSGQPSGLYAAYDFRGDRSDGGMDCGYVVVHQAVGQTEFSVVRTDTSFVPSTLMIEGVPEVGVLRKLPCFLGKDIATAI